MARAIPETPKNRRSSVSAAARSLLLIACAYTPSVSRGSEWPRRSCTVLRSTPSSTRALAIGASQIMEREPAQTGPPRRRNPGAAAPAFVAQRSAKLTDEDERLRVRTREIAAREMVSEHLRQSHRKGHRPAPRLRLWLPEDVPAAC